MSSPALVVIDWGLGGRPTWSALREALAKPAHAKPPIDVRYASDADHTPWGKLPARAVLRRLERLGQRARDEGAIGLVIACNAAGSALVTTRTTQIAGLPTWSVVHAGQQLLREVHAAHPGTRLGVIGGRGTVRSGVYGRWLRAEGLTIRQRVAQPLSALVEAGQCAGPDVDAAIVPIVAPLRRCDAVLLGCTHYPALREPLQRALPGVRLLDPAPRLVAGVVANIADVCNSALAMARPRS